MGFKEKSQSSPQTMNLIEGIGTGCDPQEGKGQRHVSSSKSELYLSSLRHGLGIALAPMALNFFTKGRLPVGL